MKKKKVLFIDRDGTLICEPEDFQVDSFQKLLFKPGVIRNLHFITKNLDYDFIMVSNQDGLGTPAFPYEDFMPVHTLMLSVFATEGVFFKNAHIDCTLPEQNEPTRKPGTAMLTEYMDGSYDLAGSYVIGDRETDAQLALNLGCKALILKERDENSFDHPAITYVDNWDQIAEILYAGERCVEVERTTSETDIRVRLNLDGQGICHIDTGIGFFDHMLEQIARHGRLDLDIRMHGDLQVDEHHTIEDVALALGECLRKALGDKRGIERYGFTLPMDDSLCQVVLDFGGRPWIVWDAEFHREYIGSMPTEMFFHFFKSLSDAAGMNLNIQACGDNEHHKIEGIFKALGRSIRMAVKRDIYHYELPSSKGVL